MVLTGYLRITAPMLLPLFGQVVALVFAIVVLCCVNARAMTLTWYVHCYVCHIAMFSEFECAMCWQRYRSDMVMV